MTIKRAIPSVQSCGKFKIKCKSEGSSNLSRLKKFYNKLKDPRKELPPNTYNPSKIYPCHLALKDSHFSKLKK